MSYINYRCPYNKSIETIESLKGLSRQERQKLIKEYKLVSGNYYLSNRATKSYYQSQKGE